MRMRMMALVASVAMVPAAAIAADHRDGPAVRSDPSIDITDLYAWLPDATHVALVMNVFPNASTGAKFSGAARYVFHLTSRAQYGGPAEPELKVICTFEAGSPQNTSCWVGTGLYLHGDASTSAGLVSADGRVKVFAGLRDDPFFFNLAGWNLSRSALAAALPTLTPDQAGCPQLTPASSAALVTQLHTGMSSGAAVDDFAHTNVLSLVVQLDKTLVTTSLDPILGVWASTNR